MHLSMTCGYMPGCIGRIVQLHAAYYQPLVGFGLPFESRVARELSAFCERLDPTKDGLWLCMDADTNTVHGAIAIDGTEAPTRGLICAGSSPPMRSEAQAQATNCWTRPWLFASNVPIRASIYPLLKACTPRDICTKKQDFI